MSDLVRVPIEGGGSFLIRTAPFAGGEPPERSGPVRAGRIGDRVGEGVVEAAATLQAALAPVVAMSRAVLDQLAAAAPQEVQVEFGVELTAEAGAVIAKAAGNCHLTVTLTWAPGRRAGEAAGEREPGTADGAARCR